MNRRDFLNLTCKALYGLPAVLLLPELKKLKDSGKILKISPAGDSPFMTLFKHKFWEIDGQIYGPADYMPVSPKVYKLFEEIWAEPSYPQPGGLKNFLTEDP